MNRPNKDAVFLTVARAFAERSTCARRRVGCVLVDAHGRTLATGYNGPAKGEAHCIEKPCEGAGLPSGTGLDKCEAIHAEQNALMFCPDIMRIDTCYTTTAPCVHCVKMLMNTSCRRIVFAQNYPHSGESKRLWLRSRPDRTMEMYE